MNEATTALRDHLVRVLDWEDAHVSFVRALEGVPADKRGARAAGFEHSLWQLVEHIRIAQDDILRFSRNFDGAYESPEWPDGYWPAAPTPRTDAEWEESLRGYRADRSAMEAMVADPVRDLTAPFPWGDGQTLLREAMLAADHTAYHVGQLVLLRRLVGAWRG